MTTDDGNASSNGDRNALRDALKTAPTTTTTKYLPLDGTDAVRAGRRTEMTIAAKVNTTDPRIALAAILVMLRPDWAPEATYAAITADARPPRDVVEHAVACALDPGSRTPGRIGIYDLRQPTPVPRAPRCPHGTLADSDGTGADCHGCGTRATPPDPALLATLRAAATGPTRHTPEDAS